MRGLLGVWLHLKCYWAARDPLNESVLVKHCLSAKDMSGIPWAVHAHECVCVCVCAQLCSNLSLNIKEDLHTGLILEVLFANVTCSVGFTDGRAMIIDGHILQACHSACYMSL